MVMKDQQKESLRYIHLSDFKKFDYSISEQGKQLVQSTDNEDYGKICF